ncbi:MAG: YicC family protein [Alphaproteobacteria bacterium]
MSIVSMTGFAREEGADEGAQWIWEARSVNARGLDIRCKLPPGLDRLEAPVREAIAARARRGNVSVNLTLSRRAGEGALRVNRALLDEVIRLRDELGDIVDPAPPRLDALLAVRGVVELAEDEPDEAVETARDAMLLASLERTLDAMSAMRREEGARLAAIFDDQIAELTKLAGSASKTAAVQPDAIKARLADQVAALMEADPGLPEERLAQEAALLAAKADVAEELDRLRAHIAAVSDLMTSGDAVGRRLDFLCQELNREANTLCAKSSDIDLTNIGLALKAAIERLREQVQNVE